MMRDRRTVIAGAILAALAITIALFAWQQWQRARLAGVETGLVTKQRGAAIGSGSDAVQTIGNSMSNETMVHATVKEGMDAIDQAPGGDSNDAADRAACRLRSYRHSGKCVALLGPVAD
jgi:predicted transcriptional regulator